MLQSEFAGLTDAQAEQALAAAGENRLNGKNRANAAELFFSQFKDVMILILAAATLISVLMGETTEAVTIILIVLINAALGFLQEYRTEKTLEALRELAAPSAHVKRSGAVRKIEASAVVPGDLLILQAGDRIAADCRLQNAVRMSCDESMLTGESTAAEKQDGDSAYMGCCVLTGHAEAIVTATGMNTEMGKIAGMMDSAQEQPTPLQRRLKQLGGFVAAACVIISLAVAVLGYLQGSGFWEMLLTGISLAVAAVPEGLPAIVTVTLALSVGRILRRGAVIRRLHAVETLGSAGVICTDKTGTLTQNKMTVQQIYLPEHRILVTGSECDILTEHGKTVTALHDPALHRLCEAAALCTQAKLRQANGHYCAEGEPTEAAALIAAAKAGVTPETAARKWRRIAENPFDPQRKRMSVIVQGEEKKFLFCKGAPDLLLEHCTRILHGGEMRAMTVRDRKEILEVCSRMADEALRVLAFAGSSTPEREEEQLCFYGLMGMQDPLRPEAAPAVKQCRQAGIKPVMITGDGYGTALAAARKAGIFRRGDGILTGRELDGMTDAQLTAQCMGTSVYCRVSPAHKLRIVHAYQCAGQVTAMTGDGVNDAPAVREADIGISMGLSGTDVTRQASGVVILDDNFATIVAAVEEGRVIYENIRRSIRFLLASNLGEVLGMLFAMLLHLPVMLMPIQILLVNLFTDGLPAIALGMEKPTPDIMHQKPRPKQESLFADGLARTIVLRGIMLGAASCGAYYAVLSMSADLTVARSAALLAIITSQMLHIFECRGEGLHFKGNPALIAAALTSVLGAVLAVYLPAAQPVFSTAAVWGKNLIPVPAAAAAGPVLAGVLRIFRTKNKN